MGKAAVDSIVSGKGNVMTASREGGVHLIPLQEIIRGKKTPELGMFDLARVLSI
jgi:6-phosphofructokinase 1